MGIELLNSLIVFNNWVVTQLFELLPISKEVEFIDRIEQQKEVFNLRNSLLQLEGIVALIEVVGQFLQLSDGVLGLL